MLNEEKIRWMTKASIYEKQAGSYLTSDAMSTL